MDDKAAVVDNFDEWRRGFDPEVCWDVVLAVGDPELDPTEVDSQVTEENLTVVEIGLRELEDGGGRVRHAHQLAVGDGVMIVPGNKVMDEYGGMDELAKTWFLMQQNLSN